MAGFSGNRHIDVRPCIRSYFSEIVRLQHGISYGPPPHRGACAPHPYTHVPLLRQRRTPRAALGRGTQTAPWRPGLRQGAPSSGAPPCWKAPPSRASPPPTPCPSRRSRGRRYLFTHLFNKNLAVLVQVLCTNLVPSEGREGGALPGSDPSETTTVGLLGHLLIRGPLRLQRLLGGWAPASSLGPGWVSQPPPSLHGTVGLVRKNQDQHFVDTERVHSLPLPPRQEPRRGRGGVGIPTMLLHTPTPDHDGMWSLGSATHFWSPASLWHWDGAFGVPRGHLASGPILGQPQSRDLGPEWPYGLTRGKPVPLKSCGTPVPT